MFALPEIFFSFVVLSIVNFSKEIISPLYSLVIKEQFFIDHSIYLLVVNAIEWLGVLGLLITSIKFNKKITAIILGIILLWLSLVIFVGYVVGISMGW